MGQPNAKPIDSTLLLCWVSWVPRRLPCVGSSTRDNLGLHHLLAAAPVFPYELQKRLCCQVKCPSSTAKVALLPAVTWHLTVRKTPLVHPQKVSTNMKRMGSPPWRKTESVVLEALSGLKVREMPSWVLDVCPSDSSRASFNHKEWMESCHSQESRWSPSPSC